MRTHECLQHSHVWQKNTFFDPIVTLKLVRVRTQAETLRAQLQATEKAATAAAAAAAQEELYLSAAVEACESKSLQVRSQKMKDRTARIDTGGKGRGSLSHTATNTHKTAESSVEKIYSLHARAPVAISRSPVVVSPSFSTKRHADSSEQVRSKAFVSDSEVGRQQGRSVEKMSPRLRDRQMENNWEAPVKTILRDIGKGQRTSLRM